MQRLRDSIENMLRETLARGDTIAPGWRDEIYAIARAMVSEEREACAQIAMDHECGGEEDVVCQGQNCGLCIAGAIRMRSNK